MTIFVSPSTVYRILSAEGLLMTRKVRRRAAGERYVQEPKRPGELWATDISYVFIDGYGFFYLFTVMDAFSRYVVHWELRPTMRWALRESLLASPPLQPRK
jgi:putative transposase